MQVKDFMTRRVVTITPDTTLLAAAKLMLEHRVGGLPVLDAADRVIGVFSESDLLREEGEEGSPWLDIMVGQDEKPAASLQLDKRKVADIMTRKLVTIAPDASIAEACRLLHDHRLRRLPVVASDKIVGMIARVDLVRAVATSAEKASSAPPRDVCVDYASWLKWNGRSGVTGRGVAFGRFEYFIILSPRRPPHFDTLSMIRSHHEHQLRFCQSSARLPLGRLDLSLSDRRRRPRGWARA